MWQPRILWSRGPGGTKINGWPKLTVGQNQRLAKIDGKLTIGQNWWLAKVDSWRVAEILENLGLEKRTWEKLCLERLIKPKTVWGKTFFLANQHFWPNVLICQPLFLACRYFWPTIKCGPPLLLAKRHFWPAVSFGNCYFWPTVIRGSRRGCRIPCKTFRPWKRGSHFFMGERFCRGCSSPSAIPGSRLAKNNSCRQLTAGQKWRLAKSNRWPKFTVG